MNYLRKIALAVIASLLTLGALTRGISPAATYNKISSMIIAKQASGK